MERVDYSNPIGSPERFSTFGNHVTIGFNSGANFRMASTGAITSVDDVHARLNILGRQGAVNSGRAAPAV